ncbi:MAG: DUF362 domain-containing protein [Candidatus Omnitrophica bacterium]|nr:DUF362 domain-containing protein [Candidatus Omnitrophota bacterium]MCM8770767.1 DUF362 domain-containing protein [Candidatus Omnitrophota bacterium]
MKSTVSIVTCKNYESSRVYRSVSQAVALLGGIKNFIKPYAKVLVKPNLLMAVEPEKGITTHPEVVRAVIKLLKEINCEIFLGDGPSVWGRQIQNLDELYRRTGMEQVCREEGIELVNFDKRRWRGKFPLTTWLDDCAYLVNIPKFKTHNLTLLTGAIKNLFGLVPGTYKIELHKNYFYERDFAKILVDILEAARPALTIVDAIVAMEGDGPATAGRLRQQNLLLASRDCVALDSVLALIMGIKPLDILTTEEAARRGLGRADIDSIGIVGEKVEEVRGEPFILPLTSIRQKIPRPFVNIARRLLKFYPYLKRENCIMCSACIKTCPAKAISIKKGRIIFNYSKCIACFCCQEVCPAGAIKIKKSLVAKLATL